MISRCQLSEFFNHFQPLVHLGPSFWTSVYQGCFLGSLAATTMYHPISSPFPAGSFRRSFGPASIGGPRFLDSSLLCPLWRFLWLEYSVTESAWTLLLHQTITLIPLERQPSNQHNNTLVQLECGVNHRISVSKYYRRASLRYDNIYDSRERYVASIFNCVTHFQNGIRILASIIAYYFHRFQNVNIRIEIARITENNKYHTQLVTEIIFSLAR